MATTAGLRITNLKPFTKTLQEFADAIEVDVGTVVRKVAFDIFKGVVQRTPVDTGWARASWNISFGTQDLSVPSKPESPEGAVQQNAKQFNKLDNETFKNFPIVWITNNLDYIVPLENGHSKQSGKGFMVARTVFEVFAELKATLKQL